MIQIAVEGNGAIAATEDLMQIEGWSGDWEADSETQKEGTLATIATIVSITVGTMAIAEKLHGWYKTHHRPESGARIEKVLIVSESGKRLLLQDATVEQIRQILDDKP